MEGNSFDSGTRIEARRRRRKKADLLIITIICCNTVHISRMQSLESHNAFPIPSPGPEPQCCSLVGWLSDRLDRGGSKCELNSVSFTRVLFSSVFFQTGFLITLPKEGYVPFVRKSTIYGMYFVSKNLHGTSYFNAERKVVRPKELHRPNFFRLPSCC